MNTKTILIEVLKLPAKSRASLAQKIIASLESPDWESAMLEGARIAEKRLRAIRNGETSAIPADKAHQQMFGKK